MSSESRKYSIVWHLLQTQRLINVAFVPILILMVAGCMTRFAVWLQIHGITPFLLLPVVCGAVTGVAASYIFACATRTNQLTVALVAAAIALLAVGFEHLFFYREYCNQQAAAIQSNPNVQLITALEGDQFRPASFYQFMAAEAPAKWPLWTVDALVMIAVAAAAAWCTAETAERKLSNFFEKNSTAIGQDC
jgi:ABC-type uncharacterized transport system permease subunit